MLSIALAICAAASNAVASVLQRKANRAEAAQRSLSLQLIWKLAHRPVWFGGILAITVGFLFQAGALGTGTISVVQPLLVLELPMTLLLASWTFHAGLHVREWSAALAMTAGLVLLLFSLSPSSGDPRSASNVVWVVGLVGCLVIVGLLIWRGERHAGASRAAYLGTADGIMFGLTAALLSAVTAAFAGGITGVLTAWQTYVFIVLGPTSFFLLQSALQAGRLVAAQPGLTLSDPVVAIGWGVGAFHEQVRVGPWLIGVLVGSALIGGGTLLLSRSPLLHGESGQTEEPETASSRPSPDRGT